MCVSLYNGFSEKKKREMLQLIHIQIYNVAYAVPTYLTIKFSLTSLIIYISFFNFIATRRVFNF